MGYRMYRCSMLTNRSSETRFQSGFVLIFYATFYISSWARVIVRKLNINMICLFFLIWDELLLKFQQIWGLTDICFRSVSLQLTSAGACMEAPTTSRVMEVRIAQTQPTAPTAVASTPPPQPPAECPLSDSSSFLGTQVWLSAQFANSYRI